VVEGPRVSYRCLNTPSNVVYKMDSNVVDGNVVDKMETGRGHLWGPVEHSKGKSRESVVAISRLLCGNPRLSRLRTEGLVTGSKY
jgi:hypothetical protein